jgi:ADP-ribose pyrophosphatase
VIAHIRGREVAFDALLHGGAVVILPVNEKGELLLEKQFRPVVGEWLIEAPAGTIEEGEDPKETARRELVEETGYEPGELVYMTTIYPSPGTSTEHIHVYLARNLRFVGARPEHDELIETMWVSLPRALEMIRNGEIKDAKTIIAITFYKLFYADAADKPLHG